MVGCADVIRSYPTQDTAQLGLFLIAEPYQNSGIGKAAYDQLETIIQSWSGSNRVRLGVIRANDIVIPFWQNSGFVETGEIKPYQYDKVESEAIVFEKPLH